MAPTWAGAGLFKTNFAKSPLFTPLLIHYLGAQKKIYFSARSPARFIQTFNVIYEVNYVLMGKRKFENIALFPNF